MNEHKLTNYETSGQVALPFNEDQFKDFIVSLLGKPQTISKSFNGSFEIKKENLISLFELINQRVYQQNDSKLIQFRATIYYNDNTTTTLNGFEHLVHYNEHIPLVSRAVHLTWQYLVKFRDKSSFEKQEISISFVSDDEGPMPIFDENRTTHYYSSGVSFIISHTARTWGADIEALLTKHIDVLVKKDNKFKRYVRYNSESIGNLLLTILISITLCFAFYNTIKLKNENITDSIVWMQHYGNYIFLFALIFIIYKVSEILLEEFTFYRNLSFLLLTPESFKFKEKLTKSYRKQTVKYLVTFFSTILIGILTNYIYDYIMK